MLLFVKNHFVAKYYHMGRIRRGGGGEEVRENTIYICMHGEWKDDVSAAAEMWNK